jgi:hypothetical protein
MLVVRLSNSTVCSTHIIKAENQGKMYACLVLLRVPTAFNFEKESNLRVRTLRNQVITTMLSHSWFKEKSKEDDIV